MVAKEAAIFYSFFVKFRNSRQGSGTNYSLVGIINIKARD